MANNYSETSFELPWEWPQEAQRDFFNILAVAGCDVVDDEKHPWLDENYKVPDWIDMDELMADYDARDPDDESGAARYYFNGTVWHERSSYCTNRSEDSVGYYEMEMYDSNVVEGLLQKIADHYRIKRKYSIKVDSACTCSKPRVGEFGGYQSEIYDRSSQPCPSCSGVCLVQMAYGENAQAVRNEVICNVLKDLQKGDDVFPELVINELHGNDVYISDYAFFWRDRIRESVLRTLRKNRHLAKADGIVLVYIYGRDNVEHSGCERISGAEIYGHEELWKEEVDG